MSLGWGHPGRHLQVARRSGRTGSQQPLTPHTGSACFDLPGGRPVAVPLSVLPTCSGRLHTAPPPTPTPTPASSCPAAAAPASCSGSTVWGGCSCRGDGYPWAHGRHSGPGQSSYHPSQTLRLDSVTRHAVPGALLRLVPPRGHQHLSYLLRSCGVAGCWGFGPHLSVHWLYLAGPAASPAGVTAGHTQRPFLGRRWLAAPTTLDHGV